MSIAHFRQKIKKIYADVKLATNKEGNRDYSVGSGNLYRRQVTIDFTGRTPGDTVAIRLDTRALYKANKCAFTFCDLRVFDSDGTTPLLFAVQGYNTNYTTIWVKFLSNISGSRNIFLEYGNPSLPSLSNLSFIFPVLGLSSLVYWFSADEIHLDKVGIGLPSGLNTVHNWRNLARRNDLNFITDNFAPLLIKNQINGLPIVRFINFNLIRTNWQKLWNDEITMSILARGSSTSAYQSIIRVQSNASNYIVYPWQNGQCILSNDGGTGGLNSGFVNNVWNHGIARWKRNTTNGFNTWRNGSLVAQRNSNNSDLISSSLQVGGFGDQESCNADVGEVLIYSLSLSDIQRAELGKYKLIKYRHTGTDFPSISVGSETTINQVAYQTKSYLPFSSFNISSRTKNTLYGTSDSSGSVAINNMLSKQLASGQSLENWTLGSGASYDRTGKGYSEYSIKHSYTSTPVTSRVQFKRTIAGQDWNNLSNWLYQNPTEAGGYSQYQIRLDDYITFELYCDDVSKIDITNTSIRLTDSLNTTTYTGALSANINSLISGITNTVKIQILSLVRTGASLTFAQCDNFIEFNTVGTSPVDVYYSNVQIVKNYKANPDFVNLNSCDLALDVSLNNTTYFEQVTSRGVVASDRTDKEMTTFSYLDYLTYIKGKKFGELDSFPPYPIYFDTIEELGANDSKRLYHSYFVRKILGFVFPNTQVSVDLDFLSGTDTTSIFGTLAGVNDHIPNLNYFTILPEQTVGEVLDELLSGCFGYLTYVEQTGRITARSGYYSLDNSISTEIADEHIYSYKTETNKDTTLINQIDFELQRDKLFLHIEMQTPMLYSSRDLNLLIPAGGSNGSVATFQLRISDSWSAAFQVIPFGNLKWEGWNSAYAQNSNAFNNSGTEIISVELLDSDTIELKIISYDNNPKYLRQLDIRGDFLVLGPNGSFYTGISYNENPGSASKYSLQDPSSIRRNGQYIYEPNKYYTFAGMDDNRNYRQAQVYTDILNRLSNGNDLITVEIQYIPEIRLFSMVTLRNEDGEKITGLVTRADIDADGEKGFTKTLSILKF